MGVTDLTGCRLSEVQLLPWEYVRDYCIELPDTSSSPSLSTLAAAIPGSLSPIPRITSLLH